MKQRFIPARAGNRAPYDDHLRIGQVHPRTSGEQFESNNEFRKGTGSSPHERGTVIFSPRATSPARFIPARAGNSVT